MPRLATVVPRVVSPTLIPITRPSVKMLLTRGRPNSVVLANSASRCSGCGFIVMVVNSTLSISVTVRVSACSNTWPSENSSKYRPAIALVSLSNADCRSPKAFMPGLGPGIHETQSTPQRRLVHGRAKPGHERSGGSPSLEHRAALLVERGDRLLVVLGKRAARLVLGFEVEHG